MQVMQVRMHRSFAGTELPGKENAMMMTMMKQLGCALCAAVFVTMSAAPADAGSILESARRMADNVELTAAPMAQPTNCGQATVARAESDAERTGVGTHIAGGVFLPVIWPLVMDSMNPPAPPASLQNGLDRDEASCYGAYWGDNVKARRTKAGWTGTWIGIGTYVGLSVLLASLGPGY